MSLFVLNPDSPTPNYPKSLPGIYLNVMGSSPEFLTNATSISLTEARLINARLDKNESLSYLNLKLLGLFAKSALALNETLQNCTYSAGSTENPAYHNRLAEASLMETM